MTPEQIQELLDKLFALGGTAASKGFELALRQVYVHVVTTAIWGVAMLAASIACFVLASRLWKRRARLHEAAKKDRYNSYISTVDEDMGTIFSVAGGICFLVVFFVNLTDVVARLINPEWYAVKLLMDLAF